jgi:hypothetical protein
MRLAIMRLEKETGLVVNACDLGFEHLVPGHPQSVWLAVRISKEEDLELAKKRAYEIYPVELGWRVAFGTVHGTLITEPEKAKETELFLGGKVPFEGEYSVLPVNHCIFDPKPHEHWMYKAGAWCKAEPKGYP